MPAAQRFHAPSRDGEILAVPGFDAIPQLIGKNRCLLDCSKIVIDGIPLKELRFQARYEALTQCETPETDVLGRASAPMIVTGHQPELSHPGVWVKNFALHGLARKVGATPLNLIVDNDTLKTASLHLPAFRENDPSTVHRESVAFDLLSAETSYEDRPVMNEELFHTFPERAAKLYYNWGYQPLLPQVWQNDQSLDEAFIATRRRCEQKWGCQNRELRVSQLSETQAFGHFAKQILNDLPRFQQVYNAAIQSYRRLNRIRSESHPAPELAPDEAPFWVRTGTGHRTRATSSSNPSSLRPRALTLTLFARLCLGDFFIHGIGGGKYDEVTDRIIRDYFGIEPPAYQVLSATLHLPLPTFPATDEDLRRANRFVRSLHWNPQLQLLPAYAADPVALQLHAEKERLIHSEPPRSEHQARKRWFRALQTVTNSMRPYVEARIPAAEETERRIRLEVEANRILRRRDYSWVFYPEATLRPFMQRFLNPAENLG